VVVAGALLETKLHVPRARRGQVARPRLSERLRRGTQTALTLVSAPAGFGKTTVVTEWLAAAGAERHPWVALARPARQRSRGVLDLLRRALQDAVDGVGAEVLSLLASPHSSREAVLATLINDLDAIRRRAPPGGAVDAGTRRLRGFIAGFAGYDRYIVDYLIEEVLQRQPEDVRAAIPGHGPRRSGPWTGEDMFERTARAG
jgi:ATP/maltotriose-dependent transcriptional regulator MalT